MLSVIIPSRNEQFLQKTINDLLQKAETDIEIIAVCDGEKQDIESDSRVNVITFGESKGMRAAINAGVAIARGEYIMKCDGHCMFDQGFDRKMIDEMKDNWVMIPRRKRLDAEKWCLIEDGRDPIDYEYISYPDNPNDFGGAGLNGKEWKERFKERKDILIDETPSFQGSCWLMNRDYFYELELMDEVNYGKFWNEAQEIGFKAYTSGGSVMVNKKTWYAHLHKGKTYGRGYFLDKRELSKGRNQTMKWMTNEAWDKQTLPFECFIKLFTGMPGWETKKP